MIDMSTGFTLVRELDATPAELWQAWTDPDEVAIWWHPAGARTPRESVSIDARVGGQYVYTMVDETSGNEVVTGGVYRELVENERLVFTWGYPDGDPEDTPIVTVTFEPLGELTRMTFDLRGVTGMAGDGFFYDGWESVLDQLAGFIGQTEVAG
ncbi:SRPBCC domain-containing protein [Glaciihabitans sp. UYNi722]|uniref:SRPBCC family protein n=1 Tax=Glaciihabitans sp. UYNi722 TaxID=3156344 RepID=UPI00339A1FD1